MFWLDSRCTTISVVLICQGIMLLELAVYLISQATQNMWRQSLVRSIPILTTSDGGDIRAIAIVEKRNGA